MSDPVPYIGSVRPTYPFYWKNKGDCVFAGSKTRTFSGNLVILQPETVSQHFVEVKLSYDFLTSAQVAALRAMALSGNSFQADFEGTGTTHTVWFDPVNGVPDPKHWESGLDLVSANVEGTANDVWEGDLNLIIENV